MIYDFLLVGHGLAGGILAHTLASNGYAVLVIDAPTENSASRVAAGLINPLAGKRLAKSWLADTLVPFAVNFYLNLEEQTGEKLFFPKPILKLFSSVEDQNNWMGRSAGNAYGDFVQTVFTQLPASPTVHQEPGGVLINKGGYVDVPLLLQTLRRLRVQKGELLSETFDISYLQVAEEQVRYKNVVARNLIFCEGHQATQNPFFRWLPFALNKGEVLKIKSPVPLDNDYIYNKAVYVLPKENTYLRVGATYNWRDVDEQPTAAGLEELKGKIEDILKVPYTVEGHAAGIRPAVRDRRPLIGTHPEYLRIKIFNGMGSKGVMMAPYLAHHLMRVLAHQEELLPEINIFRYITLYKSNINLR